MRLAPGSISFRAVVLMWPLSFLSGAVHATQPNPLQIEDALKTLVEVGPIALSPDGNWVAYTVQDNHKRRSARDEQYLQFTRTGAPIWAVGCDIWITNTRTGESKNLTQADGTSWWPVWSPDGKHLAFYSDRRGLAHLWVWDAATEQLRQLSDAIARPFFIFDVVRWTPDNRKILLNVLPEGMTVDQPTGLTSGKAHNEEDRERNSTGPTVTVYSSFPSLPAPEGAARSDSKEIEEDSSVKQFVSDLALVDEASGDIDRIVKHAHMVADYWISPDGKYVAYTHGKRRGATARQFVYELVLFNLIGRSTKSLVPTLEHEFGNSVSWSPDSRSLAYTTSAFRTPNQKANGDCFLVSIAGGKPRNLTEGTHPPFGGDDRGPLWDLSGNYIYLISTEYSIDVGIEDRTDTVWKASISDHGLSIAARIPDRVILQILGPSTGGRLWSPDGRDSIIVGTRDEKTKQIGFYAIHTPTGKPTKLLEESSDFGWHMTFDVSSGGQRMVYIEQDAQHPADIWTTNSDFTDRQRISKLNPHLDGMTFGASRLIEWRSIDGTPLQGALLLPADYQVGKKYPLIVEVYGAEYLSEAVYRFGFGPGVFNLQLLATRGYAVFLPDAPLHGGTPMLELLKAVMPGVQRVVDLGIADPDRLGIMGLSYGGYSTLSLIVQTTRFKAAVDRAGPADLISAYGKMDKRGSSGLISWSETGQGRMIGTPWEFRDRYIENSPVFFLDRVHTPLLIIHGDLDTTVPYQQGEEVFVGLRRLGKEVVYAKYAGEGHSEYTWGFANAVDYCNRMIDWFDRHLKTDTPHLVQ